MMILSLVGCSSLLPGKAQPNIELTGLSASVAGTATARASNKSSSGGNLETAVAEATQLRQSYSVTQTAYAASHSASFSATQTVVAPVVAELPLYGVDPAKGYAAWLHKPVTVEVTGYQQYAYANDYMQVTAGDFVLAADINWNTQYGTSGCGFMFRSNADKNKPNQYLVLLTRFATGYAAFTAVYEGDPANVQVFYPKDNDKTFQWQNDTTNRLAVVARGDIIRIYTNGVMIGEIDTTQPPPDLRLPAAPQKPLDTSNVAAMNNYKDQLAQYDQVVKQLQSSYQQALSNYQKTRAVFRDGFLAMIAASESGKTTCNFNDAWLWIVSE
ncbi:MAG: hypothetical protein M1281_15265 [Chloroflexi bacterium]|nr:hypothetical protein [Chloroflexota bacterium]